MKVKSSSLMPTTQGSENSRRFFTSNHYTTSMNIPELKINLNYFDETIT